MGICLFSLCFTSYTPLVLTFGRRAEVLEGYYFLCRLHTRYFPCFNSFLSLYLTHHGWLDEKFTTIMTKKRNDLDSLGSLYLPLFHGAINAYRPLHEVAQSCFSGSG